MQPSVEKQLQNQDSVTTEYIVGGNAYFNNRIWNGLGDTLQPNLTHLEIERARRDDEVSSSVEFLIDSIFADGGQVVTGTPADDPDYEVAREIADFCQKAIEAASKSFIFTLRQQFRAAFYHGQKVGEIVLRYVDDQQFNNKLVLDRINLKPLKATAFLTDQFENVLGLIAAQNTRAAGSIANLSSPVDLSEDEVIPREKFQILSFEHDDNSPLGMTQIKAAYEALCDKYLTRIQYKDWRKKNAATQKFFTTAEKVVDIQEINPTTGEPLTFPNGRPRVKNAQKALMDAAAEMENHSVLVAPYGTSCTQLEVFGNGEQFEKSFRLNNNGIRKSILGDALATGAADKDARAARQSSMNVVDLRVKSFKTLICINVERDLLTLLTRVNYEQKYWHLVPDYSLGDTERRDWATDVTAAAGAGYTFAKKHLPELDKQFSLDPRDGEDASMQETAAAPARKANNDPNSSNAPSGNNSTDGKTGNLPDKGGKNQ